MAKVSAQRAADLTGRSKSTIQRAMNQGKLSFELDNNQRRIIDVSELDRVFGLVPQKEEKDSPAMDTQQTETLLEMERMKMRIKMLEAQLDSAENQLEDLKGQRDQWQKQAQQVLITSQYSQKQAEEYKAQLREREERAKKRREEMMADRMKQMQNRTQNQNQPPRKLTEENAAQASMQKPADTTGATETKPAEEASAFDFQGLWRKIRGGKVA